MTMSIGATAGAGLLSGFIGGSSPYTFTANPFPPGHFAVHKVQGREALSALYSFDVTVTALSLMDGAIDLILGQQASLTIHQGDGPPRAIHGIIARVGTVTRHKTHDVTQYRLRLVPRMWLLKHQKRSRIFQHLRVDEVVELVLREHNVATRWQLQQAYPPREYCTQYEETDYAFVRRLLAESGIYFYFAQGSSLLEDAIGAAAGAVGGAAGAVAGAALSAALGSLMPSETVVFSDAPECYPAVDDGSLFAAAAGEAMLSASASIEVGGFSAGASLDLFTPKLYFLDVEGLSSGAWDKVTAFGLTQAIRPTAAEYRDYDPARPLARVIAGTTLKTEESAAIASVGVSAGPGGVSVDASLDVGAAIKGLLGSLLETPRLEVYEHHSDYRVPDWKAAGREPSLILRRRRRDSLLAKGESRCSGLAPGHRFRLEDHSSEPLNRPYVVTAVRHEGEVSAAGEVYKNFFECVPAEVLFLPDRPKRRRAISALTATVVGPAGEEIYVDEVGQIKVQFHWDRQGGMNEHSSCWIRTLQAWGGPAWGTQFIPRVGMEVTVAFDAGDPDRPLVLGCLYNGTHPPSFPLPADKSRSGVRTQTYPGGGGFNEISLEDLAGSEQIYVHAQRDMDSVVERNRTGHIKNDDRLQVDHDKTTNVTNTTSLTTKTLLETVTENHTSHVDGDRVDVIAGNSDARVSGMRTVRVEGKDQQLTKGSADYRYDDDLTMRVRGCETVLVGRADAQRSYLLHVEGVSKLSATGLMELSSDKEIVLRCGKSAIRITPDQIEVSGPAISVKGDGGAMAISDTGFNIKAKMEGSIKAERFVIQSVAASIAMATELKLDGAKILLNSPEQASDPPPPEPVTPTKITLKNQEGRSLSYQRYLIICDDGSEQSGIVGKDGTVEIDLPSSGKIFFPDLDKVKD